jgi:predicted exporter
LLFERIHLLTLVFGASLIGGAQDYGTYFCNRIAPDASALDSWQLLRRLLPALVLTLVTTVIGYMGLALTPFPGLRQMAVFSALGLIFAWLTVVFWFPILSRNGTLKSARVVNWCAISLERWPFLRLQPSGLWVAGLLSPSLFLACHDSVSKMISDCRIRRKSDRRPDQTERY